MQIWLGGEWFTVIGILDPVPLAPELDLSALVGWQAAETYLGWVLANTANPQAPNEVKVSRPSDAWPP